MRMGRKRERECSPWKKGENECAMSAPRNQDRMVPPSNATPSRGGPEGGGVPVQTESPDTSVSGGGRPDLVARKASPSTCPHGASPGAQASTRVPKATVYPGVSTHWTSSLEWLQTRKRHEASEREEGKGKGEGGCPGSSVERAPICPEPGPLPQTLGRSRGEKVRILAQAPTIGGLWWRLMVRGEAGRSDRRDKCLSHEPSAMRAYPMQLTGRRPTSSERTLERNL